MIVLAALLLGGGSAYYLFNKVVVKAEVNDTDEKYVSAKAFQVGAFTKYDNALKVAKNNNGIVISDNDIYRVYVAILTDSNLIEKLSKYYAEIGLNYYLRDVMVEEKFLSETHSLYEMMKKSSKDTYITINLEILKKYEEML